MNRILLLSNDSGVKQKNVDFLSQNGFEVIEASDALNGLILANSNGFEAIIIDEELPDMDGYMACQKIRRCSEIPIILLGTKPHSNVQVEANKLCFDIYLQKPVSPHILMSHIKAILDRIKTRKPVSPHILMSHIKAILDRIKTRKPVAVEITAVKSEETIAPKVARTQIAEVEEPSEMQATSVSLLLESEPIRLKKTVETKIASSHPGKKTPASEEAAFKVWQDARVAKFASALVSGKLSEINPAIDTSVNGSFTYPEADKLLETSGEETINVLEALTMDNILKKKPFEKLRVDPKGSLQLVPVERCPHCGSGNMIRGQLIEHFACGNIALDQDFKTDHKYICPKCNRELKLLGTDYHNVGIQHKCLDCKELFPMPATKWRSLNTLRIWAIEELQEVWLYSYSLQPDKKTWLEFQLKPKAQLIDFLRLRGYQVEELPEIKGASGAVHTIDILATRDDVLAKFYVGIGILTPISGEREVRLEEVFKFDTRAYDMGINYEVVIAIPKLSPEAVKFAERQKIRVIELSDPGALLAFISSRSRPSPAAKATHLSEISTASGHHAQLVEFLRRRGYKVSEGAKVDGKSGAKHIFDIFARRDDVIVSPSIALAVATAGERPTVGIGKVSQFDAKAYDVGVRNKVFVGVPKVSSQAKQFAKQQRIKIIEGYELEGLIRSSASI